MAHSHRAVNRADTNTDGSLTGKPKKKKCSQTTLDEKSVVNTVVEPDEPHQGPKIIILAGVDYCSQKGDLRCTLTAPTRITRSVRRSAQADEADIDEVPK